MTRMKLENRIDKTSTEFEDQNKRLKEILSKFRSPERLMIDIILILILLFMLYVLMKVLTMK